MADLDTKKEKELRRKAVKIAEQSEALEGYKPLTGADGLVYELQKKWINSELTSDEVVAILIEEYSDKS